MQEVIEDAVGRTTAIDAVQGIEQMFEQPQRPIGEADAGTTAGQRLLPGDHALPQQLLRVGCLPIDLAPVGAPLPAQLGHHLACQASIEQAVIRVDA